MTSTFISTEIHNGMQQVPLDLIDPNPWQPRIGEDHEHIKKIAESIAGNGLLQVPSARRCGDRYQLAFGHSRLAAFKFLRDATDQGARFETMPLNIVELSDRQMADAAAAENVARKDLSAIEMARGIKRYIDDFGATQIEAGRVFGYSSQSAVSNLLRLLQLPEPVQQQVNNGKLPERHARELIALGKANEAAAVKVADEYIKTTSKPDAGDEDDLRDSFDNMLSRAYDKQGVRFGDHEKPAYWDLSWPGKPITMASFEKDPFVVPACKGCPFFIDANNDYWRRCLRPKCFKLKGELWLQHALETASKKLGIPVLGKDEKATVVFGIDNMLGPDEIAKAVKAKDPTLRLAPLEAPKNRYDYNPDGRARLLGFKVLMLMTTDAGALRKAYKAVEQPKVESSWERENRLRNERRKRNIKLCEIAAPHMASALGVPDLLIPVLHETCDYMSNDERKKWDEKGVEARRADIIRMMLEKYTGAENYSDTPSESKMIEMISELARTLKTKLPNGWHHEAAAVPVNGKAKKGKK
jgi:ParB/RepB/Spo0J family partition protein